MNGFVALMTCAGYRSATARAELLGGGLTANLYVLTNVLLLKVSSIKVGLVRTLLGFVSSFSQSMSVIIRFDPNSSRSRV